MKHTPLVITILLSLMFGVITTSAKTVYCGGEGPEPFHDISQKFFPNHKWLEQGWGVRDFLFLENTESLLFRTNTHFLTKYSVQTGFLTGLTPMVYSIARVKHAQDRYVVTEGNNWVFDSHSKEWFQFSGPARPLLHLFWKGESLYTLSYETTGQAPNHFDIFKYNVGASQAAKVCSFTPPPTIKHLIYKVAQGYHYPNVMFYTIDKNIFGRTFVDTYTMNVEQSCEVTFKSIANDFPGRVQQVFRFDGAHSVGVKLDQPDNNILWVQRNGCSLHSVNNQVPTVLDHSNPTLATWTHDQGVQVYRLASQEKFDVLKDWSITQLVPRDIQLSGDQKSLFVAPLLEGERYRKLAHVELNPQ